MDGVQTREKLLDLAAARGSPAMSVWIEGFVNRCLKASRGGEEIGALNPRQVRCIENEWATLCRPAPVADARGQFELSF